MNEDWYDYEQLVKYPLETTVRQAWESGYRAGLRRQAILDVKRFFELEEKIRELESQIYNGSTK